MDFLSFVGSAAAAVVAAAAAVVVVVVVDDIDSVALVALATEYTRCHCSQVLDCS